MNKHLWLIANTEFWIFVFSIDANKISVVKSGHGPSGFNFSRVTDCPTRTTHLIINLSQEG